MSLGLNLGLNPGIGNVGSAGPLSAMALTQIADGRVFQRAKGTTSGPVTLSGTTTGQATAIEARVLLTADDSVVVDWTTIDASPGSSSFSGSISTPQGGPYYCEVRDTVETGIGDAGTTDVYVGILLLGYGQSNMSGMFDVTSSPPASSAGTAYFDGSNWIAPPIGNGVRELLNGVKALTGLPVGIVNGSTPGAVSAYFIAGSGGFDSVLAPLIDGIGGDAEYVLVAHGEGDADGVSYGKTTMKANWAQAHSDIASYIGRTTAQIPMLFNSLSTYGGSQATISDADWWDVQEAISELCAENANIHYSHSRMDLPRADFFHHTAAGYAEAGKRFAQSVAVLNGDETAVPAWFITAVEDTAATTTRITLVHSLGTDFTPTSSISGFEVSADGSTWISATGARVDATTIDLTHASLATGTAADRYVRYQYGTAPDVSSTVVDNSSLAPPLNVSAGQLLVDYALPAMTSATTFSPNENVTYAATLTASRPSTFAIGGTDGALFEIQNGDELHFVTAPDYENPSDANTDNDYEITLTPTATDNSDEGAAQSVTISVQDVAEGGSPVKTFRGSEHVTAGYIHTFSVDLGAAAADRLVIVSAGNQKNQSVAPTVVVNGVTLTNLVYLTGSNNGHGLFAGIVASGNGIQDVVITWDAGNADYHKIMSVWTVTGLASTTEKQVASLAYPNLNIAVESGDLLFFGEYRVSGSGDVSGSTEAPDRSANITGGHGSDADWTIASTNASFSIANSYSGSAHAVAFA